MLTRFAVMLQELIPLAQSDTRVFEQIHILAVAGLRNVDWTAITVGAVQCPNILLRVLLISYVFCCMQPTLTRVLHCKLLKHNVCTHLSFDCLS